MNTQENEAEGKGLAIAGEGLFLLNLLFPLLPLIPLGLVYYRNRDKNNLFLESHLRQPWLAALISSALFILINIVAAVSGGYSSLENIISIHTLIALEVYTLAVILPFTVPGLLGLTKAISGHAYRYPLLGRLL